PNIVSVYDTGEENGAYYIVMEYVQGRTLRDIIRSEGPLLPQRAADIGADIAGALAFAHRHGVVHRDVKPGNVLIDRAGRVKVTDFGIARAGGDMQENLTQTGAVMGTATYFSPDQGQRVHADPALAPPLDATDMTPALDATRVVSQTRLGTMLPEEAPARSGMGRYVALLLGLLAVLGVLLWLLASQLGLFDKAATRVAVPTVVNLTEDQARARLEAKGFKVKVERKANDTVESGKVFDQMPGADVKA